MVSVEVEDDMIVRHGFAIGPEHGSRRGDCVDDDGFAIGPEHGTRRGDCVDDGGGCDAAAGVVAGILTATTGDCDDGCAAEMKASFSPMS